MRTLITGGRIIDGTGAPAIEGDLLIEDCRIAEVGSTTLAPDTVVDIKGAVIAPGFIDVHSHSDFALPTDPDAEWKVAQGVTTEIVGNCGLGLAPSNDNVEALYAFAGPMIFGESAERCSHDLDHFRGRLERDGVSTNVAMLVPHGNVRCAAMGMVDREGTASELDHMRQLVGEGMDQGAFGLSSGLVYPPGSYAETEELVSLAQVVAPYGGVYATHMRDEGPRLEEAVEEAITIGSRARVSVQLSHHKAAGKENWGKVVDTLARINRANEQGLSVHSDVYPYVAGSTVLAAICLPLWVFEGSHAHMMQRLRDPATRARIVEAMKQRLEEFINLPGLLGLLPTRWILPLAAPKIAEILTISSVRHHHEVEGKTVRQLMKERGQNLYDTCIDLLIQEEGAVIAIAEMMTDTDVRTVMRHPRTMIGTDGMPTREGKPHPRGYGTFPRVLGRYVGDDVFGLEEAVRRMTSLPAHKFGIPDRGVLKAGNVADLVVFDPATVMDTATFDNPKRGPVGMPHVWVGGAHTIKDGKHTGARNGTVLRHGGRGSA